MAKINRPDYCCGNCPELMRGGYDCTCLGNPRCKKNKTPVLDEVLDLDQRATAGPWGADSTECEEGIIWGAPRQLGGGYLKQPMVTDFVEDHGDAELIAYYRTAALAMAKALQEVIALHVETGGKECLTCTDERGPKPYPCPTAKAINEHLGGQE